MNGLNSAIAELAHTNLGIPNRGLISMQLSYSTADIENSIFYTAEFSPTPLSQPLGAATILVIHGEMFPLEEGYIPQPAIPLTADSGLFRLIDLTEQR